LDLKGGQCYWLFVVCEDQEDLTLASSTWFPCNGQRN